MTGLQATASCLAISLVAAWPAATGLGQTATERVFLEDFSEGLDAWREQRLDRRSTEYRVTAVDGNRVLESSSENAATALVRPLRGGPVAPGRLRWRWKVRSVLGGNARETERSGDDYVARVFVLFGDDELAEGTRALAYAWAGRQPVGSIYPNPYRSEVMTVVVRSGNDRAGEWVAEDRDLVADYRRAFGEPALLVAGVAILVDTDDTGSTATAWFDDLELRTAPTRAR